MNRAASFVFALSIALVFPQLSAETLHDWPQYRGPERDGTSPESGLLAQWPEDGPKVLWKRDVGTGFSGLAVAAGRIYTMMAEDDKEYAVAFDAATGEEVWRTEIGALFPSDFGDGPRSTPAVAGDNVVVLGSYGDLVALAAGDGARRWALNLQQDIGGAVPPHGYSTAPMIEGDLLLVEVGGGQGKAYAALDPATGANRWTTQDGSATYTSPIAVTLGGKRQLISLGGHRIVSLDTNGELVWSHAWDGGIAMPIFIAPDKLFVSTYDAAMVVRLTESDDGIKVEEVWQNAEMNNHFNSSVIHDGYIYGFDNNVLKCVAVADGERMWAKRGFGEGSLILADGHLIILSERGLLVQAEATPEGFEEEGRFQAIDGQSWTSPALAGGRLYIRNLKQMMSLDLRGVID